MTSAGITSVVVSVLYTLMSFVASFLSVVQPVDMLKMADEKAYSAVLISDIHVDGWYFNSRNDTLRESFVGIRATDHGYNTVVMAGDLTNSGVEKEYKFLKNTAMFYIPHSMQIIPTAGNHDLHSCNEEPDFALGMSLYKDFLSCVGIRTGKPYYTYKDKTASYIVLCSERTIFNDEHLHDAANISSEQLSWFENELSSASATGKPVFVVLHQQLPANPSQNWSINPGTVGVRIKELLTEYSEKNSSEIIFVSGHCHTPISEASVKQENNNLFYVDCPTFLGNVETGEGAGYGIVCSIYNNKIVFSGVDFKNRTSLGLNWNYSR